MTRSRFAIPLVNGTFDHGLPAPLPGYHQVVLSFRTRPTAGRMALFVRIGNDDDWLPVPDAQNVDLTSARVAVAYGAVSALRFVISGLSGGSDLEALVCTGDSWPGIGIPEGAFSGDRAFTQQTYDEANKKRGTQWEASRLVTLASNAPADNVFSIILTGSKPVDLKSRVFGYDGLGLVGRIYKAPVYSGGVPDPWFNMNPRYVGAQPLAKLLTGFTLTNKGTKCGADIVGIGPASQQSRGSTPHEFGSNRILDEPNTAYLLEIESRDPASQTAWARLEIYEGPLDLPLN